MFGTPGGGIHPLIGGVIFRILHLLPVAQHSRVIQELRRVTAPALWRSAMEPHTVWPNQARAYSSTCIQSESFD